MAAKHDDSALIQDFVNLDVQAERLLDLSRLSEVARGAIVRAPDPLFGGLPEHAALIYRCNLIVVSLQAEHPGYCVVCDGHDEPCPAEAANLAMKERLQYLSNKYRELWVLPDGSSSWPFEVSKGSGPGQPQTAIERAMVQHLYAAKVSMGQVAYLLGLSDSEAGSIDAKLRDRLYKAARSAPVCSFAAHTYDAPLSEGLRARTRELAQARVLS